MCLAIYAAKNDVPFEKLKADAYNLIPSLNSLNPEQPFKASDVDSALECYDLRYCTFPIKDIEHISGIPIPRNKRNGRKQAVHLAGARAIQQVNDQFNNTNWRDGNGRPKGSSKAPQIIYEWRKQHPEGIKADCIRDTQLSKKTVYKWWEWDNGKKDAMAHFNLTSEEYDKWAEMIEKHFADTPKRRLKYLKGEVE